MFNKIINNFLIRVGFTLVNRQGNTVKMVSGKQVISNKRRKKPYSLDDSGWKILKG